MRTAEQFDLTGRASKFAPSRYAAGVATRRRIDKTEYLPLESLAPTERSALADQLYDICSATTHGYARDEFEAETFGAGQGRLALYYDAKGVLAGFATAAIERIEYAHRTHAVFSAGVYFRLGYHGGPWSGLFGLREALRFKLREPRTPVAYLTRSASPAVYRLLASSMPRTYPSRNRPTPADVEALVRTVGARRGYTPVGENPWVVHSLAAPRDAARLRGLEHDPAARFFVHLNPRFAEGRALLTWVPLDVTNIAVGAVRLLRARLVR